MTIRIGTAGWSLRKEMADTFTSRGTHLERYARLLNAVEINSSFYRPHRRDTYRRWSDNTPRDFTFSVKVPKQMTHDRCLIHCENHLEQFLDEVGGLNDKLGALLVQLPPSLRWTDLAARNFFSTLRTLYQGPVVCEPRHPTWFQHEASCQLQEFEVARVAADPAIMPEGANPGGFTEIVYFRWHGSPKMYYSSYRAAKLSVLASRLSKIESASTSVWCIFDNTAEGAATCNALELSGFVSSATLTNSFFPRGSVSRR
ncbi:MAG TPA: DUF72 domain-containing protein [Lacipirellulaceae bacterium]|jgi:uncharacterized protein YecE (DUF72 family)